MYEIKRLELEARQALLRANIAFHAAAAELIGNSRTIEARYAKKKLEKKTKAVPGAR